MADTSPAWIFKARKISGYMNNFGGASSVQGAEVLDQAGVVVCTVRDSCSESGERNARLIAAAPELQDAAADAHEAMAMVCLLLHNDGKVRHGEDAHVDLIAARDHLAAVLVKSGYGIKDGVA